MGKQVGTRHEPARGGGCRCVKYVIVHAEEFFVQYIQEPEK